MRVFVVTLHEALSAFRTKPIVFSSLGSAKDSIERHVEKAFQEKMHIRWRQYDDPLNDYRRHAAFMSSVPLGSEFEVAPQAGTITECEVQP